VSTFKTAFSLIKTGQFREFFAIACSKVVRVEHYRIDLFDLNSAQEVEAQSLEFETLTSDQFLAILEDWPDSEEERERHRRLCELYGPLLEVLIFRRKDRSEPEHFHMYLNPSDRLPEIPEKISKLALEHNSVLRIRVYTFEESRGNGLGKLSTGASASYLAKRYKGIAAWRGTANTGSIKMADKTGFSKIASLTRVSLPSQKGMKGLLILRKLV